MYAMRRELNQYRESGHMAEASVASPHRLVQMLFEGALERIAVARGAMQQGNIRMKGEKVGQAITIIDGLRASLDHGKGVDLAEKLEALYEYMNRRLLEGNAHNDLAALDEVSQLLREIKSGWDAIPELLRRAS
ncbi:flagellar export chaperone FliS [Thiocystis minor]|uniref:flagellar export chaperone FliS n=1 Tax=Thiocystis minor TaxID=61597 RepID=UPI001912EBE5|nr:flagellar export chaperone FliS [Thiocystis minor]MBK5964132.1 flagellar export chaperone FliS [Thiocystis minor]